MIKRVLLFTCVCTLAVLSTSAQTFRNKLFPSNEISGEEFKKQAINKIQSLQNYLEVLVGGCDKSTCPADTSPKFFWISSMIWSLLATGVSGVLIG